MSALLLPARVLAWLLFSGQTSPYSDVQEKKYINKAKDNVDETNSSDQANETTNESFMGIVANVT